MNIADRFRFDECVLLVLAGGAIGFGIALIVQVLSNMFTNKEDRS